jgi:hypothetical protein
VFHVLLYAGVEETANLTIWRHAENFLLHSSGRLVDFGHGVGGLNEHSGAIRLNPFRCAYHLDGFFHGVSECT